MPTRLPPLLDSAILFARRGARAKARDHAVDTLSAGVRLGATGIHADAWRTRDGVAVIDRSGRARRFPRRPIADVDRTELPESILTLDDLYETIGVETPLWLSVAAPADAAAVVEAAGRHDARHSLWLAHRDLEVLSAWRDMAPSIRLVNIVELEALPLGPERRAAELAAARIDAAAMSERDWSGGLVTLFHRFEVLAFAQGADHERQLVSVIDMGIDGVSGDHPERLAAAAAAFD